MSLVQEALKRKSQEELNAATPAKPEAPSSTPTPPPPPQTPPQTPVGPASQPPPEKKKTGGGAKAILIWIFILVFLGGLGYATYFLLAKHFSGEDLLKFAKAKVHKEPEPTPTMRPPEERSTAYKLLKKTKDITDKEHANQVKAATLLEPEAQPLPAPTATPIPTLTATDPIPTPLPKTEKKPPAKKVVSQKPVPDEEKTTRNTTLPEPAPRKVANVEEPREPIEWPKIRLNGVMAKQSSTDGLAVIDGKITACGQEVEGCKLISVHDDGVVLEYEGEIRTLRVGGQMY